MALPLLSLEHEWHRQRTALRSGRLRPPPLVTAGVEVEWTPEAGRATRMGGLAVIFGHFPATFGDFVQLARARLHLAPGQARQLDPVLGARVMALWAWLPDLRCDCYLEYDRATDAAQAWLIDPGGNAEELDTEATAERLDAHFLDSLVLNGSGHWGGEAGLARLVERFGRRPLLVAAQVADLLERCPREPRKVLEAARARWSALDAEQEEPWAALAGAEPPWALVQLGRLALRLGLLRAARALLSGNAAADQAPVAWFDLGQVCEALGDLPEAEQAFVHYAAARPHDPDAWRRLLFCRLRLDHLQVAEETLRRYRAAGGKDDELAERYLTVVVRARLVAAERERLAAWAAARLGPALAHERPLGPWAGELARRRLGEEGAAAATDAAERLAAGFARAGVAAADGDRLARAVLLGLPLGAPPHRADPPSEEHALVARARVVAAACWGWAGHDGLAPDPDPEAIAGLCRLLARRWGGGRG